MRTPFRTRIKIMKLRFKKFMNADVPYKAWAIWFIVSMLWIMTHIMMCLISKSFMDSSVFTLLMAASLVNMIACAYVGSINVD